MFRPMRRFKQQLPDSEAISILENNNTCVLAMMGEEYPYSLPISYAYIDGKVYMHGAKVGHKIDAITKNEKVSLCVINDDTVIEEKYTNKYKSVIVFGTARILTDVEITKPICKAFAQKLCPTALDGIDAEVEKDIDQTAVIEITPKHITGKAGLEFYK